MELQSLKSVAGGWRVSGKRCDYCKTMAASVFCRADSAFLCVNCDNRVHCLVKHGRVMMCEVCEQAPAAVTCKADAAALCSSCDADIHSANPLARRHDRVPVEPFFDSSDSVVNCSSPFSFLVPNEEEQDSTVSWLLQTSTSSNIINSKSEHNGDLFFTEIDPFLDVGIHQNGNSDHDHHRSSVANDSVVPVQIPIMANDTCYDIDFCRSKLSSFNYSTQSLSQSVSSSSLDVGVVPDGNFISDASHFGRNLSSDSDRSGPISGNNTNNQAAPACALDREARVLRYREKRKNRKFEKTIRYASRKAYAETRPRIKGRFAKRTEIDSDLLFNSASCIASLSDAQYSVVPTF